MITEAPASAVGWLLLLCVWFVIGVGFHLGGKVVGKLIK